MSLFRCDKCGCVENTALCRFWVRDFDPEERRLKPPALCSACDPQIGKWHNIFKRESADEWILLNDRTICREKYLETSNFQTRAKSQGLQSLGKVKDFFRNKNKNGE